MFRSTVKIEQEEEWFVATCLENNIASQGKSEREAMANLDEAIALYVESDSLNDIDAMLKGSITESLIGVIPDTGNTLEDYRAERLSKYERVD